MMARHAAAQAIMIDHHAAVEAIVVGSHVAALETAMASLAMPRPDDPS